jgi:hypothetical protein
MIVRRIVVVVMLVVDYVPGGVVGHGGQTGFPLGQHSGLLGHIGLQFGLAIQSHIALHTGCDGANPNKLTSTPTKNRTRTIFLRCFFIASPDVKHRIQTCNVDAGCED